VDKKQDFRVLWGLEIHTVVLRVMPLGVPWFLKSMLLLGGTMVFEKHAAIIVRGS
jgi:hypothetical protein